MNNVVEQSIHNQNDRTYSCLLNANFAGAGFKSEHFEDIFKSQAKIGFFEVHAENYMGAGGMPHFQLDKIREHYAISLHGVGLSIGGEIPLDVDHLARLKALNERYEPELFSEHLAWSSHGQNFYNDLLPLPYNTQTLKQVCEHINQVQDVMGRRMLLENPSTYVIFEQSTMDEIEFITEIAKRTGCGLLLDVNNVYISATNHQYDAKQYLNDFPIQHVGEIHLAGHAVDEDEKGNPLLIDAHDREVDKAVWALYENLIQKTGVIPTLIEWDNELPSWDILKN